MMHNDEETTLPPGTVNGSHHRLDVSAESYYAILIEDSRWRYPSSSPLLMTGLFPRHLPVRVSSMPAHEVLPPATYTIVEDVVAVDGGGRLAFRKAWRDRYEASHVMRKLLRDLSVAWGLSGSLAAGAFLAICWTTADDVGYGIAYGLPWLWAMVLSVGTIFWVRGELHRERVQWDRRYHKEVSLHTRSSETHEPEHAGKA